MRISILRLAFITVLVNVGACQNQFGANDATPNMAINVNDELHVVSSFNDPKVQETLSRYPVDDTLFVFDIDNTLLTTRPGQFLASDEWYEWQRSLSDDAPEKIACRLRMQGLAYYLSHMESTERDVSSNFLSQVQTDGFASIALTARSPQFRFPTERELIANEFDFSKSLPSEADGIPGYYLPAQSRSIKSPRNASYQNGIAMLAGQHKGDALVDLLRRLDLGKYRRIIFFDDKSKNVEAMLETFRKDERAAIVFHYTAVDTAISQERIKRGLRGQEKLAMSYLHFQRREGCDL